MPPQKGGFCVDPTSTALSGSRSSTSSPVTHQILVRGKIKPGVRIEGENFIKDPDSRILINLEVYHRWAEGQVSVCAETGPDQLLLKGQKVQTLQMEPMMVCIEEDFVRHKSVINVKT